MQRLLNLSQKIKNIKHKDGTVTTCYSRFLRVMEKNKGTQNQLIGKDISGSRIIRQPEDNTPTVEEIVGSRDKSSLLQKIAKFNNDIIQEYIDLCIPY